mmetsp:Transcript_114728/g.244786  ORF Transcript_114728/g.244786 Transcript_114728/m.244786 type:complete len:231 (+) Transcript_114728:299-991(+)
MIASFFLARRWACVRIRLRAAPGKPLRVLSSRWRPWCVTFMRPRSRCSVFASGPRSWRGPSGAVFPSSRVMWSIQRCRCQCNRPPALSSATTNRSSLRPLRPIRCWGPLCRPGARRAAQALFPSPQSSSSGTVTPSLCPRRRCLSPLGPLAQRRPFALGAEPMLSSTISRWDASWLRSGTRSTWTALPRMPPVEPMLPWSVRHSRRQFERTSRTPLPRAAARGPRLLLAP